MAFKITDSVLEIPEGVGALELDAFGGCPSVSAVSVSSLEAWLQIQFAGHGSNPLEEGVTLLVGGEPLVDMVVPEGTSQINKCAFRGCTSLQHAEIPASVQRVGFRAFKDCAALTSVAFEGPVACGVGAFEGCTSIASVSVPNLDAWLGMQFADPSANPLHGGAALLVDGKPLVELVVPEGTVHLGDYAFCGCASLKCVRILGAELPECHQSFSCPVMASQVALDAADGDCFSKPALAAGRVLLGAAGEIQDFGEEYAEFVRAQSAAVCAALGYDTDALRWMAAFDLFSKETAAQVASECAKLGRAEATAAIMEAVASQDEDDDLLLL